MAKRKKLEDLKHLPAWMPLADRIEIWRKESTTNGQGCWLWERPLNRKGYGHAWVARKHFAIHRLSYQHFVGPIPEALQIDHLCKNRNCWNPEHLEVVTLRENIRRGDAGKPQASRTHCPQGHPYNEENTARRNGERVCKKCARDRANKIYWDSQRNPDNINLLFHPIGKDWLPRVDRAMTPSEISKVIATAWNRAGFPGNPPEHIYLEDADG